MTIAMYCVFAAALLLMVSKLPVGYFQIQAGGYNNKDPRAQQAALEGAGKRALAAHQNAFEAFPIFAVGVILAQMGEATQGTVDTLALVFIVARVLFQICYLKNWATPRSLVWFVGFVSSLALMLSPAWA